MTTIDNSISVLNTAVTLVMTDIHRLKKDDENKHGGYKYVSVDDFKDLVRPLLAKAGLSLSMTETEYALETLQGKNGPVTNARITYEFTLRHNCGEQDAPERTTIMLPHTGAQTAGAAKSYALKEYLKGRFMVSTGDKDMIEGGSDADAFKPQEYSGSKDRTTPRPTLGSAIKVDTKSKTDARPDYERLDKGIRQISETGTLEDLKMYIESNKTAINALPDDWYSTLMEAKDACKATLMEKVG